VLGASLPATRPFFHDRRATAVGHREAIYHLAVRIPLATALAEELAFRGALLALIQRRRSPAAAVAWTSLLFGVSHALLTLKHYDGNPASGLAANPRQGGGESQCSGTMLSTAGAGYVLAWLRLRSRSLLAPSSPTPPAMPRPAWQADGWSATPAKDVASVAADWRARCRHLATRSASAILEGALAVDGFNLPIVALVHGAYLSRYNHVLERTDLVYGHQLELRRSSTTLSAARPNRPSPLIATCWASVPLRGQAEVCWPPTRSRSAANSAANDVSLVSRRILNWPSARWPVSTMRRRYRSYSPERTIRMTGAP
jgi:Type II CAAX prenyl endopeptidase Rce1-like